MLRKIGLAVLAVGVILLPSCRQTGRQKVLTVRGGPLLQDVFADLADSFLASHPDIDLRTDFSCPPCVLTTRMDEGLEVDAFVSAGEVELDALSEAKILDPSTTRHIGRARLVLAVPPSNPAEVSNLGDVHLDRVQAIAIGDPEQTSPGHYARQAFERVGLWDEIEPKLVLMETGCKAHRAVLVENADAALVYSFCLTGEVDKPKVVQEIPPDLHDPIYVSVTLAPDADADAAKAFVDFMLGDEAQATLRAYGIEPAEAAPDEESS